MFHSSHTLMVPEQIQGEYEQGTSVHHIPEHDPEQEREHDDGEQARVDFLISGTPVGVHNQLEVACETVKLEVGRGGLAWEAKFV